MYRKLRTVPTKPCLSGLMGRILKASNSFYIYKALFLPTAAPNLTPLNTLSVVQKIQQNSSANIKLELLPANVLFSLLLWVFITNIYKVDMSGNTHLDERAEMPTTPKIEKPFRPS